MEHFLGMSRSESSLKIQMSGPVWTRIIEDQTQRSCVSQGQSKRSEIGKLRSGKQEQVGNRAGRISQVSWKGRGVTN